MDREKSEEFRPLSVGDVITQRELASQLIFQNAEYPPRTSLLQRLKNGAEIEPGPLTIVQPYFDLGPFIVPSPDVTLRSEQIRRYILDAHLALNDIEGRGSATEFSRAAQQITARAWEAVQERRNASLQARNWNGFRARVRDQIYACEVSWMLWTASKCLLYQFRWLGSKAFSVASARATALAAA